MPENPGVDLIRGPIQLAADMIAAQQERLVEQLQGPQAPQRREMVGDVPLNDIMPMILEQMEQQEQ